MAQLFKFRESKRKSAKALSFSQVNYHDCQALKMERICYESLLYYGTHAMLYDNSFDVLTDSSIWELLSSYFKKSPLPSDNYERNWPILGVPYSMFRLIVTVLRLFHLDFLSIEDIAIGASVLAELIEWNGDTASNTNDNPSAAMLYVLTAKLLLEQTLQSKGGMNPRSNFDEDMHRCFQILSSMELHCYIRRHCLWPLDILSLVARDKKHMQTIHEKKARIQGGLTM